MTFDSHCWTPITTPCAGERTAEEMRNQREKLEETGDHVRACVGCSRRVKPFHLPKPPSSCPALYLPSFRAAVTPFDPARSWTR